MARRPISFWFSTKSYSRCHGETAQFCGFPADFPDPREFRSAQTGTCRVAQENVASQEGGRETCRIPIVLAGKELLKTSECALEVLAARVPLAVPPARWSKLAGCFAGGRARLGIDLAY